MDAVLEEAVILMSDRKIGVMKDLLPLLDQVDRTGEPILIIAEDIKGNVLATLVRTSRSSPAGR